jgi:hypothetical protein
MQHRGFVATLLRATSRFVASLLTEQRAYTDQPK